MKLLEVSTPFHTMNYRSSGRGTVREVILPFYKVRVSGLAPGITFVVASDLQGREVNADNRLAGEAVSEELRLLLELGEMRQPDFCLLSGDLFDYPDLKKLGGTGDVTSVWNAFAKLGCPVIGVLGNHDTVDEVELADNAIVLNGSATKVRGVKIAGVSGIVGNESKNQRKSEEKFKNELMKATANQPDILILHQGPDIPDDGEPGEPLVRHFLAATGSNLVFTGHKHWKRIHTRIGNNEVFNVANRVLLVTA